MNYVHGLWLAVFLFWLGEDLFSHYHWFTSPGRNGRHFADDVFKCIFLNEKVYNLIKNSPKFVHKGPIEKKTCIGLDNGLAPNSTGAVTSEATQKRLQYISWIMTWSELYYGLVLGPFYEWFFHRNSHSMEIQFYCHPSCIEVIAMLLCTWNDSRINLILESFLYVVTVCE